MKTKVRRTLFAVFSALFVSTASLAAFAACGGGKKAKLTLSAGEGGTLSKTEYSLKAGADLYSYLQKIEVGITVDKLEFAGWYNGSDLIEEGDTMPEGGLTLTAKYNAPFTFNLHTWDIEKDDYGAAMATQGKAFWHEPLDVLTFFTMPESYVIDDAKANTTSTKSLQVDQTFDLYVKPGEIYVSFRANAPEGVETGGQMAAQAASFGKGFTVPACAFTASENYRFTGWAAEKDGAVVYHEGDTFKTTGDVTLYAVWEAGKTDIFGGDDYLFLSDKEGEIFLRRAGLEEKSGTYDAATGVFTFKDGQRTVLGGKIVGDTYYYFRDLTGKTFLSSGTQNETLAFGENDEVTYTVTAGGSAPAVTKGIYSADPETGDYFFEGEGTTFFFTVFIDPETEGYAFARTTETSTERGFYALYSEGEKGYDVTRAFQLDGMHDKIGYASAGLYELEGGKYVRQMTAYYGLESEVVESGAEGTMSVADTPVNYALLLTDEDWFLFRLEKKEFTENGKKFDGILRLEDGYRGDFGTYDEILVEETSLTLDGFGGATYNREEMTYTIETLEAHGAALSHIALQPAAGDPVYIQLYSAGGFPYYEASSARPKIMEVANSLYKSFEYFAGGMGGITLYDGGFFYFYDDTQVAVYTYFTDLFDGVTQYSRGIDFGILTAKEGEDGVYGYESLLLAQGLLEDGEALFDIRYTEDGDIETSFIPALMGDVEASVGDKLLKVDKWGYLTFGEDTYAYGEYSVNQIEDYGYYDEEDVGYLLREYTFGDTTVCLRAGDDDYCFDTFVGENDLLEIIAKQYPGQSSQFYRIYFIEGLPANAEETKQAGIVLPVSDDGVNWYEEVLLHGTLSYSPASESYQLILDKPTEDDLQEFYAQFDKMTFKIGAYGNRAAAAIVYDNEETTVRAADGSTLTLDGYGAAVYKPAEGEAFTGEYDKLAADATAALYRILSTTGEEMYFLFTQDAQKEWTFTPVDASEAGIYSYMSGDSIYFDTYIVFFGIGADGNGVYFEKFISSENELIERFGTYAATDKTVVMSGVTFTEYELTFKDGAGKEQTSYVAVAEVDYSATEGDESGSANVFVERIMPMGDYSVKNGGFVIGDGYSLARFKAPDGTVWYGEFGRENLIDDSPNHSGYDVEEGDHSKDGRQLIFYAYYMTPKGENEIYELYEARHFIFDVDTQDGQIYLDLRENLTGTFAFFEKGALNETVLIYFDGHGNGVIKKQGSADVPVAYTYDEEANEGVITPETGDSFTFSVFNMNEGNERWNIYVDTGEEHLYINEDWSVLSLVALGVYETEDAIYSGVYTDRYGDSYYGVYEYLTDDLVAFATDSGMRYFNVQEEEGTFTLNEDEFVIEGGVLYAYQGPARRTNGLSIPKGVTVISDNVFSYMYIIGGIQLNDVEIIGARAFYETSITDGGSVLSSDRVKEIGDEAFFTELVRDGAFNTITHVNMPALVTIGARAFYNCNQMAMGNGVITLRDIQTIGEQAFMHNINNTSGGTMILDLTQVPDLSKVTIAESAFQAGSGSMTPDAQPVIIRINAAQVSQTENWPEKFKGWLSYSGNGGAEIAESSLLGGTEDPSSEAVASREPLCLPSVTRAALCQTSPEYACTVKGRLHLQL